MGGTMATRLNRNGGGQRRTSEIEQRGRNNAGRAPSNGDKLHKTSRGVTKMCSAGPDEAGADDAAPPNAPENWWEVTAKHTSAVEPRRAMPFHRHERYPYPRFAFLLSATV